MIAPVRQQRQPQRAGRADLDFRLLAKAAAVKAMYPDD